MSIEELIMLEYTRILSHFFHILQAITKYHPEGRVNKVKILLTSRHIPSIWHNHEILICGTDES